MNTITHITKHFKELHFGGNWTWVNLKDTLSDISWQEATAKLSDFNSIAALTYHIHYYVEAQIKVLQGGSLDASDKFSYDAPDIKSPEDWQELLDTIWTNANTFIELLEELPNDKLWDTFCEEKYGNYYRNFNGMIEHSHYHLGQIVILKKLLRQKKELV